MKQYEYIIEFMYVQYMSYQHTKHMQGYNIIKSAR